MTTTDIVTMTVQDNSPDRVPEHGSQAHDDPAKPARALPGRPPGIRADSSGLTDRQRRVIEVIRDSVQRRGYPAPPPWRTN
jgi:repressor LexA